ncbi:unnamed protein product [Onchocerca flexuosa]|uniref:Jacalin-type lectin domain-containing protein n=1 Tax=Onchocerca flexuosa TaxID=387005 RepID=A0A183HB65_9BILA|nr:unnamed protein product [Onchocerca flexuosa]
MGKCQVMPTSGIVIKVSMVRNVSGDAGNKLDYGGNEEGVIIFGNDEFIRDAKRIGGLGLGLNSSFPKII